MPYKRYNKKRTYKRKRGYRRNYRKKYNKALITHVKGQGIPDMLTVKLSYVDNVVITTVGSLPYFIYTFAGNSCFDPNVSSTGHQPMYFDQYSPLYARYRVMGSAIKIDVINNSGVSAMFYVCEPNTNVSATSDITTIYEQARSGAPKIVPIAARVASRMKKYASTRKVCGLTKTQVYDDTFSALVTTGPSNLWYWNLLFANLDGTSAIVGHFVIKITYYVQFFDRVLAAQS